jgi:adenylosuccinate synthase
LLDDVGEAIRKEGAEFGATTGRPRRCGWFDAVIARYSAMVNGIDSWCVTKLDVMDKLEVIKVCVAYEHKGKRLTAFPSSARVLSECIPIYEEKPGWLCKTSDIKIYDDLPERAREYIQYLEAITDVPVGVLSVGPGRESTLQLVRESKAEMA